jgi:hypothetical protein
MIYASVILFALALTSPQSPVEEVEAKAIEAAKSTNVHQIEPSLPNKAFEEWLRAVTGTQVDIKWEVNDCGEQTGDPSLDKGRDFPMCAEAQVTLRGNRRLSVSLSVGTFKNGVRTGPASFAFATITESNGSLHWVKSLSRLREAIKAAK